MSLHVIYHFSIHTHVPINGDISFTNLAQECKLPEKDVQRIVRHAMTNFIFCEPKTGYVAHTSASRLLVDNPVLTALVGIGLEERFPASHQMVQALEKHADSQEPTLSAWGLANHAEAPLFAELAMRHPNRMQRFAGAMTAMANQIPSSTFCDNYDWKALGNATVVDVGGGKGPVSMAIAKQFPALKFIVQDLKQPIEEGRANLPADLAGRVEYQEHDFFTEQPVKGAELYFFR